VFLHEEEGARDGKSFAARLCADHFDRGIRDRRAVRRERVVVLEVSNIKTEREVTPPTTAIA